MLFIVVVPQEGGDGRAAAARSRAAGQHAGPRPRREGLLVAGHDRRPRSLHRDDERAAVLQVSRHHHLDAARHALGLAARRPHRARAQGLEHRGRAHRRRARPPSRRRPDGRRHGSRRDRARRTTTTTTPRPAARPTAARASSTQLLGMLLFIISEIMVFGAFFTAYFFIRFVARATTGSRSTATSCRSPSPA